jgi:outer membrane protein W
MYGGGIDFGISKIIHIWTGAMAYHGKGELTLTKESTQITLIPLEAGLIFQIPEKRGIANLYFGIGAQYYQYREENPLAAIKGEAWGITGRVGVALKISARFMIDMHINYSHCEVKPLDIKANLGGYQAGIGLGYLL